MKNVIVQIFIPSSFYTIERIESNLTKVEVVGTVPDSFQNTNSINGFRGLFGLNRAII